MLLVAELDACRSRARLRRLEPLAGGGHGDRCPAGRRLISGGLAHNLLLAQRFDAGAADRAGRPGPNVAMCEGPDPDEFAGRIRDLSDCR